MLAWAGGRARRPITPERLFERSEPCACVWLSARWASSQSRAPGARHRRGGHRRGPAGGAACVLWTLAKSWRGGRPWSRPARRRRFRRRGFRPRRPSAGDGWRGQGDARIDSDHRNRPGHGDPTGHSPGQRACLRPVVQGGIPRRADGPQGPAADADRPASLSDRPAAVRGDARPRPGLAGGRAARPEPLLGAEVAELDRHPDLRHPARAGSAGHRDGEAGPGDRRQCAVEPGIHAHHGARIRTRGPAADRCRQPGGGQRVRLPSR